METYKVGTFIQFNVTISILPMRHGNCVEWALTSLRFSISILPMRHGNPEDPEKIKELDVISILPMRHGNSKPGNKGLSSKIHFDPTYEAWKRKFHKYPVIHGEISILPMRHGNYTGTCHLITSFTLFRSYLWGMETELTQNEFDGQGNFDPTYEAWKLLHNSIPTVSSFCPISILPMRHGNSSRTTATLTSFAISILPMRHGNLPPSVTLIGNVEFRSYLWGMETIHSAKKLGWR